MIASPVVVLDEGGEPAFEIARPKMVSEQYAAYLVGDPTIDFDGSADGMVRHDAKSSKITRDQS
jgi:hypothetical protein